MVPKRLWDIIWLHLLGPSLEPIIGTRTHFRSLWLWGLWPDHYHSNVSHFHQGWLKVHYNTRNLVFKYEKLVCIYEISRELVFICVIYRWSRCLTIMTIIFKIVDMLNILGKQSTVHSVKIHKNLIWGIDLLAKTVSVTDIFEIIAPWYADIKF